MKNRPILIMYTISFIVVLYAAILLKHVRISGIKEEAIRAGVAYYTNDAKGKKEFKWKECK